MPDAVDYAKHPDHPLCGVPQAVLDVARSTMAGAVEWKDVDPEMADPLADTIVADLLASGLLQVAPAARQVPLTERQSEEGWCCRDDCCGPGSWCCAHANPHDHTYGDSDG